MAGAPGVVVHGAADVIRAFGQIDASLRRSLGDDLKAAAAPVVEAAKSKDSQYAGASLTTIRARRNGPRVWVEQGAKKVTGKRADFGRLQMITVLRPALAEHTDEVFDGVDKALNKYATLAGFFI